MSYKNEKCGIYKITNPKGKVYIGQSVHIRARWLRYKKLHCKDQRLIYNSLVKYGVNSHNFEILEECSRELCNEREIYYIELYSSQDRACGLNIRAGGDNRSKFSKSTSELMTKNARRKKELGLFSSKFEGVSLNNIGRWVSSIKILDKWYYLTYSRNESDANDISSAARLQLESGVIDIKLIKQNIGIGLRKKSCRANGDDCKQYSFNKASGKYFVYAFINGKVINIRNFEIESDAAEFGKIIRRMVLDGEYDGILMLKNEKQKKSTDIKKGISLQKSTGKFAASIRFNKKQFYIGTFNTFEMASLAMNDANIISLNLETAEDTLRIKLDEIKLKYKNN